MCPKRLEERTRLRGCEATRGLERAAKALQALACRDQGPRVEAEHQADSSFSALGRRGLTRLRPAPKPPLDHAPFLVL